MSIASTQLSSDPAAAVQMTDSAALKVYELKQEEGNLELKLRVFVTGGGCSGFSYGFSFEEKSNEDDFEIIKKLLVSPPHMAADAANASSSAAKPVVTEIKLLIDAQSFAYLSGAEIDYRKDIQGEQFIIRNNPNAKTTCGCGSSFSAD